MVNTASHPSRVRGLKLKELMSYEFFIVSHPSRVRGLKSVTATGSINPGAVAPFTGAWIEMTSSEDDAYGGDVAPFTGAWIEIQKTGFDIDTVNVSHPSRVRGLK